MAGPSRRSCSECRTAKRKCSGEEPSCHRCKTQRRKCQYPDGSITVSSREQLDNTRLHLHQQRRSVEEPPISCTATYFLNADFYTRKNLIDVTSYGLILPLPTHLSDAVAVDIQTHGFDIDIYFESAHVFFPIGMKTLAFNHYEKMKSH